MATQTGPTTVAELLAIGDEGRWEIIAGTPRYRPGASLMHADCAGRLIREVGRYADARELGDAGPALSILLATDPATLLVPDLVAEVLADDDRAQDLDEKIWLYLRAGVPLLWIVNPNRCSVTVYTADGAVRFALPGGVLEGGDVLPGLALPVDRIFA